MPDFQCDLNCPFRPSGLVFCCWMCHISRKDFFEKHQEYKDLWTKERGFLGENGCKLPREKRPSECNEYDCKETIFNISLVWKDSKWIIGTVNAAPLQDIDLKELQKVLSGKFSDV